MGWLLAFGGEIFKFLWWLLLWVPRRLRLVKKQKIEAEERLLVILEKDRGLVERKLEREIEPAKIRGLKEELEEVEAKQRTCYARIRDRLLEQVGLPPYGELVAKDRDEPMLEPENEVKLTEAITRLDSLPPPPTADDFMASGNAKYALERYDEALADYNRSLELRPDDPSTLNNRGTTY